MTTETKIVLTVTHKKPLPEGATDVVAQRFYGWSYSRGVEVGVTAEMMKPPMPSLEVERCLGHGAGPSGHQRRVDCVHCWRRLAPRGGEVQYITPPKEFPCPMKLPAEVKDE